LKIVIAIFLSLFFVFPTIALADSPNSSDSGWLDHFRKSTVLLSYETTKNGNIANSICTGFLVSTDGRTAYLVSAKHCFDKISKSKPFMDIRFSENDITLNSTFQIAVRDSNGRVFWKAISTGEDLAAMPVNLHLPFPVDAIGIQDFANANDIYEGESIVIYGFPDFTVSDQHDHPLLRSGIIAWTELNQPENHQFLVDAAIFPGNSGSPVFKLPTGLCRNGNLLVGDRAPFLGVAIQTYNAPSVDGGSYHVNGLGSIGAVEPASQVERLLHELGAKFTITVPKSLGC